MWEDAGVPRENPRTHEENMQTPSRKVPGGIRTRAFQQWGDMMLHDIEQQVLLFSSITNNNY